MTPTRNLRRAPPPEFWQYAARMALVTSDAHRTYSHLKAAWQRQNPGASSTEHEAAMARLAEILGT